MPNLLFPVVGNPATGRGKGQNKSKIKTNPKRLALGRNKSKTLSGFVLFVFITVHLVAFFQVLSEESFELSLLHNFKRMLHDKWVSFLPFLSSFPLLNLSQLSHCHRLRQGLGSQDSWVHFPTAFLAGHEFPCELVCSSVQQGEVDCAASSLFIKQNTLRIQAHCADLKHQAFSYYT